MVYKIKTVYNGANVYNSASIYNGAGVYKDGSDDFIYEEILGRLYPIVKIGSKFWTAENLDYIDNNLTLKLPTSFETTKVYNFWNQDKNFADENKTGYMYNFYAAMYINSLLSNGWRIPSKSDFQDLKQIQLDGQITTLRKKANYSTVWDGTNKTKFSAIPGGLRSDDNFSFLEQRLIMWSSNDINSDNATRFQMQYNNVCEFVDYLKWYLMSIRLCKDA